MEDNKIMPTKVKYCDACQEDVEAQVKERRATYTFKGESFDIHERVLQCACGKDLYDELLDSETMKTLVSLYQERVGLSLEEIKNVRLQYGLSMDLFSRILGWSKATIARYESGKYIPDATHMHVLKQLKESPESIQRFYQRSKYKLSTKEQGKIDEMLADKDQKIIERELEHVLEINYKAHEKSIESGYSSFGFKKITNLILYFSQHEVQKTKLMKLLFYTDFLNFKRNLISMTGMPYVKLPYGPVPKDYELLLSTVEKNDFININHEYNNGYDYIKLKANKTFEESLFDESELTIIEYIQKKFQDFGSVDISDYSHKEKGWQKTQEREIISYDYADALSIE